MVVDYIIIGSGIASSAFIEKIIENNKTFVVISDYSQSSSLVAGGLFNPVILKRFSPTYNAKIQTEKMYEFYEKVEKKYNNKYIHKSPLHRKFSSIEEQNNWFEASDKATLNDFLEAKVYQINNENIPSQFGYGQVLHSGWVDVKKYLLDFEKILIDKNQMVKETFDYEKLNFLNDFWHYHSIQAKHVIFCEGYGVLKNPYFNHLPMIGTKGELITIKAKDLQLNKLIKSNIFIIPLGSDLYKVGATYEWDDKTNNPTEKGKKDLIDSLKSTITCEFEVVDHQAEVRPTTKDRKPFVGEHPIYKQLYILNGLGTRGVVQAPDLADDLYNYIENGKALPNEIDIKRLKKIKWNKII